MKILFIAMPSIHFIRWIENLNDSSYELYWFDVLNKGQIKTETPLQQITNWKSRKVKYLKGEHFLRKNVPAIFNKIEHFLQVTIEEQLEKVLKEIQPDVVHSFEMQSCSYPIVNSLNKFKNIKWIYSCWGSDLYYYQNIPDHKSKIIKALNRVDYLHTDCLRDYNIAASLGFKGEFLGVIPGGTGFKLDELAKFKLPFEEKKCILVKGYEHRFGRAINVIKALQQVSNSIADFEVIVFGAHNEVIHYITENKLPFTVYNRHALNHNEILKIMGKSIIYIGNSISDGLPNTLLEAIVMGAFPIQSNPGNVTSEVVDNGKNGLLIEKPNDSSEIKKHIDDALNNLQMIQEAIPINQQIAIERLDFDKNKFKIINLYLKIKNSIN